MIELLDSVKPDGRVLPALLRAAVSMAGFGRTLWLDTTWLSPTSPLTQEPGGVFEYLDNLIESDVVKKHGLLAAELPSLVPVVSVDARDDELRRVQFLLEHKNREIAIRIRRPGASTRDLVARVRSILRLTGAQIGHVHAVLDVGFVEAVYAHNVATLTEAAAALSDLLGNGATTLLAGSIPPARTTYATTLRDRPEVSLWNEVRQGHVGDINYGDYGVAHPKPPETGDNARTPYPYLCYTVPRKTVILRRKKEKGDKSAELFADLAEELVEREDFAGPDYSWGDHELTRCRPTSGQAAGSVSRWVAMATSHHLEHVSRRTSADL